MTWLQTSAVSIVDDSLQSGGKHSRIPLFLLVYIHEKASQYTASVAGSIEVVLVYSVQVLLA